MGISYIEFEDVDIDVKRSIPPKKSPTFQHQPCPLFVNILFFLSVLILNIFWCEWYLLPMKKQISPEEAYLKANDKNAFERFIKKP